MRVQAGLLSEQLRVALRDVTSYKVLEFSTMNNSLKNFTSPGERARSTLSAGSHGRAATAPKGSPVLIRRRLPRRAAR